MAALEHYTDIIKQLFKAGKTIKTIFLIWKRKMKKQVVIRFPILDLKTKNEKTSRYPFSNFGF